MKAQPLIDYAQSASAILAAAAKETDRHGLSTTGLETIASTGITGLGKQSDATAVAEAVRLMARGCGASAYLAAIAHEAASHAMKHLAPGALSDLRSEDIIVMASGPKEEVRLVRTDSGATVQGRWRAVPRGRGYQ